jgi:environmental stress-induced protein Ves
LNKISEHTNAGADTTKVTEHARYFPREAYSSMPWRNGAGVTREIAREPAQGASFAWRLSLASLQTSGPFSSYSGYQRCVVLVDGHGFRLHVAGSGTMNLATRGDHALFAGAAEASCELLDGPCTDLSLIVQKPGTIASVSRLAISAEPCIAATAGKLRALFVLHGAIECARHSSTPAASSEDPFKLNAHDTLLVHGHGESWLISRASHEAAELLVIDFAAA